ncbi:MAG: hypothetical protein WEB04_03775 [Dehalococcoidia bacterium]
MLKRLLVLTLAAALLASVACGGDDDENGGTNNDGTPDQPTAVATQTPPQGTTGTVVLSTDSVALGGSVQLTGANWRGTGPVSLFLLTADQVADSARAIANGEAAKVGEATPDGSGNMSFEFVLENSYTTDSGATLTVQSGEEFTVFGLQNSTGSLSGPFTVL